MYQTSVRPAHPRYLLVRPLSEVRPKERPESVAFWKDWDLGTACIWSDAPFSCLTPVRPSHHPHHLITLTKFLTASLDMTENNERTTTRMHRLPLIPSVIVAPNESTNQLSKSRAMSRSVSFFARLWNENVEWMG